MRGSAVTTPPRLWLTRQSDPILFCVQCHLLHYPFATLCYVRRPPTHAQPCNYLPSNDLDATPPLRYNNAEITWGYRLAVRTAGSQLVNRGSIPRIPI